MTVEILLATYNGERFLREQVDSLLAQTYGDWRLLVRDDGSTDGTAALLEQFQTQHPQQIQFVRDDLGHLGATRNFARLLELSSGPYLMFCDQDDVWLPDKIRISLEALRHAEQESPNLPVLVHTDLVVVDAALHQMADSFWRVRRIRIDARDPLTSIIHLNGVTGCTMLMNRMAKEVSLPFPDCVRLHDWWIALNVARKGKIVSLTQPTVLYRQHGANAIGARVSLAPRKLSLQLRQFHRRLRNDYLTVKRILPEVSFWRWSIACARALIVGRIYTLSRLRMGGKRAG